MANTYQLRLNPGEGKWLEWAVAARNSMLQEYWFYRPIAYRKVSEVKDIAGTHWVVELSREGEIKQEEMFKLGWETHKLLLDWVNAHHSSNKRLSDSLDRETPGIIQLWESDMEEVRDNPAAIHNVGGCEQEQLKELNFTDYAALGRQIVQLYNWGQYGCEEIEKDGEIDDETLERGESEFHMYLTFDCRQYLRKEKGGQADA